MKTNNFKTKELDYFDPEKIVRDWISLRVNNML